MSRLLLQVRLFQVRAEVGSGLGCHARLAQAPRRAAFSSSSSSHLRFASIAGSRIAPLSHSCAAHNVRVPAMGSLAWMLTHKRDFAAVTSNTTFASEEDEKKEEGYEKVLRSLGMHPDKLVIPSSQIDPSTRWKLVPFATANHLALGSIFAWSVFNQPLMRIHGVLAPSATDWALGDITLTFSLVMGGFVWGAVFGKYLENFGPRASCLIGSTSLGLGFSLAALATQTGSLPLLYLGGTVWGLANGWAYVPPVSTLIKWFPDRKGFASGICILGYGGGALIAAPLFTSLLDVFKKSPEYLGKASDVALVNKEGSLYAADAAGKLQEVIVATASDIAKSGFDGLMDGVYLVDSGSTGVGETLFCMGLGYWALMSANAFKLKLPPVDYSPVSESAPEPEAKEETQAPKRQESMLTEFNVDTDVATKTKEFWLLYAGFGFAITGTYGIISSGKTILVDAFGAQMPEVVTAAFATSFVAAMSAANIGGRLFWSNVSDMLAKKIGGDPFYGRRLTYSAIFGLGPLCYMGTLWSIHECVENPSMLALGVFSGSVMGIMSCFGGSAATRPAIVADMFGVKNCGVLSARQLSVILPTAFAGPRIVSYYRENSIADAVMSLSDKIDDETFRNAFGAGKDSIDQLISHKTLTIARLMELVPPGTPDPTPFIYDQSLYIMAGISATALLCNVTLKPVDKALHNNTDY